MNKEIKDLKEMIDLRKVLSYLDLNGLETLLISLDIEVKPCKRLIKENKIFDILTSEEYIKGKLETLIDKEFDLIKKIIKDEGVLADSYKYNEKDFATLNYYGIVYNFGNKNINKKFYVIPHELVNLLNNIKLSDYKEKIIVNTDYNNVLKGLVNTYGIVEQEFALKFYNENNESSNKIDESINECIINQRNSAVSSYNLNDNLYYASKYLLSKNNKELLSEIINKLKTENKKEFSLDYILDYKNKSYLDENKLVLDLIDFITENDEGIQTAEEIAYTLYDLMKVHDNDYIENYCLNNTKYKKLNLLIKKDKFKKYLTELETIVPKWKNLGNVK